MRARSIPIPVVMLLALTLGAWAGSLAGVFQYDDLRNIVLDPATADPVALRERLGNGFRPLLRLSYAADHWLWGFWPAGFLLTNLLLHAASVVAVRALARHRVDALAAWCAAAVFAVQPAHAAVVASASGRSTGLSTLLLLLALLAHEQSIRQRVTTATRWSALALLMFALAVAAKEVALVFPAVVLLWEWTRPDAARGGALVRRLAPAALAALLMAAIAFACSSRLRDITAFSIALGTPMEALATHAAALPFSLALWFRPGALTIEHAPLPALAALPGMLALAAVVLAAIAARPRVPLLTLALLWPLAMLLPTHSVLARLDPVVEKALYPAWIGPSIAIGALAAAAWNRLQARRTATVCASLALASLVLCCEWRAAVWADPLRLWREATEHAPLSARAWHNRALAELDARHVAQAAACIARALTLDPDSQRSHDLALAISLLLPTPPPKEHAS
ncbi:hypothetical protein WKW79_23110 [Variovorax robiniae]|uniref:Glycosyltransferase RgtA/B/C/D-like domain-containing protein n=1 Tax=Variovorax robiniae TaxID=1836199 RepID=A0ABU8XEL4_9BURK